MTKDRDQGRYRLGLNSIFVPNSSPFSSEFNFDDNFNVKNEYLFKCN